MVAVGVNSCTEPEKSEQMFRQYVPKPPRYEGAVVAVTMARSRCSGG